MVLGSVPQQGILGKCLQLSQVNQGLMSGSGKPKLKEAHRYSMQKIPCFQSSTKSMTSYGEILFCLETGEGWQQKGHLAVEKPVSIYST